MRGAVLLLAFAACLGGCAASEPPSAATDPTETAHGEPVPPAETTFFEREYQAQVDPITFEVDVPPGAVDVRFEIWQDTNLATAKATLDLSGCGSGEADWTLPGNIIIGVGRSMKAGPLCETAEGGRQTLTIDPETTPMEGTVRLIGVPTLTA
ncbi:MAG: hypothetical protein QOJ26_906 [Thermoplasmata archaeon]|jgi:uncharacterized protein (DUF111 family)|nr:hypothetical protein [Thermoplasmata archaeon]MEA3166037.1 hypothetical protein [Thermoplasmata archaeon]